MQCLVLGKSVVLLRTYESRELQNLSWHFCHYFATNERKSKDMYNIRRLDKLKNT